MKIYTFNIRFYFDSFTSELEIARVESESHMTAQEFAADYMENDEYLFDDKTKAAEFYVCEFENEDAYYEIDDADATIDSFYITKQRYDEMKK